MGTLASAAVAFTTYQLYKKSEKKNKAIVNAEAALDGGERYLIDDLSIPKIQHVVIPVQVRVWNSGFIDSAIKNIFIIDKNGDLANTVDLTFKSQKNTVALLSGQIQDFRFWLDLGSVPPALQDQNQHFYPRDELREVLDQKVQDDFIGLKVVIELTNHADLIGDLPNPFWGTPKADPFYPHRPDRHLFRKIPFRQATASELAGD